MTQQPTSPPPRPVIPVAPVANTEQVAQPTPQPTPARKPRPLPATIRRTGAAQYSVTLDGVARRVAPSVPAAVGDLCAEALRRSSHIAVTVVQTVGARHLAIDPAGKVCDSTPPTPDDAHPDLPVPSRIGDRKPRDLGVQDDDSTRDWVAERLLGGAPEPARKRRRWLPFTRR